MAFSLRECFPEIGVVLRLLKYLGCRFNTSGSDLLLPHCLLLIKCSDVGDMLHYSCSFISEPKIGFHTKGVMQQHATLRGVLRRFSNGS